MKRGYRVVTGFFAVLSMITFSCMDEGEELPSFDEQLQKDIAAIDTYLAANNISDAVEHESGIKYIIHVHSVNDARPSAEGCVTANYKGILMASGQTFDDGQGFAFPVKEVIVGWQIALPLLNEGDSATLYIPSVYAYGYYGHPPVIPKNANLIFNIGVEHVGTTFRTKDNIGSCE